MDTYKVNALVTKQKDTYVNINDITGLYDVSWADGSTFNMHSTAIGGQLQSCIETRDGNKQQIFMALLTQLRTMPMENLFLLLPEQTAMMCRC